MPTAVPPEPNAATGCAAGGMDVRCERPRRRCVCTQSVHAEVCMPCALRHAEGVSAETEVEIEVK
eukprot:362951-Chlamydomonas_euryale.AAC.5